ncbi:hypothetical protein NE237_000502 [Protea cynaroides]|uniref:WPP domain-associated protein n=1 Tax=Protea cynaroides TaxID=273540 RepID=A0A9Q0KSE0_9MAGN|nr:hypothetical protein NE237_000502 [Protea cynaroides]
MDSSEVLDGSEVLNAGVTLPTDELTQPRISFKESENPGRDLLNDLDSYMEDINDRLTISRMVSDSVIQGMVNAVTEESAEKIALKELEVQTLNKQLKFFEADVDRIKELRSPTVEIDNDRTNFRLQSSFLGPDAQQGKNEDCFGDLRRAAEEQFQRFQEDINDLKGSKMAERMKSAVSSQSLGNHLQGKVIDKWMEVDKTLNMLRNIVNTVFHQVDNMVYLSKTSHSQWQQDQEFQEEIEAMVIQNSFKSLQEELNIQICSSETINQLMNKISSLRQELDFISRSLSSFELGYLPYHGSHETSEEWNAKRKNDINRKVSNHMSFPTFLEESDKLELKSSALERMDSAQLKRMPIDELINLFKAEIIDMKRNHESMLQEKTEKYFKLKREFLKERGSLFFRKDKEVDSLKKKIPEVIEKLDGILKDKKELPMSYEDSINTCILKDRLDALLSENHQLKNLLANKRDEVSQVSDATDKSYHLSFTGADLFEEAKKLKCVLGDLKLDVSVWEEINKCILPDVIRKLKWDAEDSDMMFRVIQDICGAIFREAVKDAESTMEWGITNSDMEYIIMQDICGVIHREAIEDAQVAINLIKTGYEKEYEKRVCLEAMLLETKKALRLETAEKEQLKQEKLSLSKLMAEKEKFVMETEFTLMKEKECYELVYQELNQLKDHLNQQEMLISYGRELDSTKSKFDEALKLIGQYEGEISKLNQKLNLATKELSVADEERRALHAAIQEKQGTISLVKSKEREHRKEMESIMLSIEGLSKALVDFECRLTKNVEQTTLRVEKLTSQHYPLVHKATVHKRMIMVFKHRLERKYSDLQKAEVEVDLLGDDVDALLSLLEKIYIALDHYSPILQYYPGIMEILELVRRELTGETVKLF